MKPKFFIAALALFTLLFFAFLVVKQQNNNLKTRITQLEKPEQIKA